MRILFVLSVLCVLRTEAGFFGFSGSKGNSAKGGCSDSMSILGSVDVKTGTGRDGAGDVVAKGKMVGSLDCLNLSEAFEVCLKLLGL